MAHFLWGHDSLNHSNFPSSIHPNPVFACWNINSRRFCCFTAFRWFQHVSASCCCCCCCCWNIVLQRHHPPRASIGKLHAFWASHESLVSRGFVRQGLDAPLETLTKALEEAPKAQKVRWWCQPKLLVVVPEVGGGWWVGWNGWNGLEIFLEGTLTILSWVWDSRNSVGFVPPPVTPFISN